MGPRYQKMMDKQACYFLPEIIDFADGNDCCHWQFLSAVVS